MEATKPTVPSAPEQVLGRSVSERLVDYLAHRRALFAGAACQRVTAGFLLDWLGCALAGAATDTGHRFIAYSRAHQGEGSCRAFGAQALGAEAAALHNGALSHIVEMDDVARASIIHPGAVIIPAALAVAEQQGSSGPELLTAVAAGYEAAIVIGEAVGPRHYYHFHNTATCGVFGAAIAAAWLLGLNETKQVWALGSAGTQAAGLWEFNAEGAMSKPLHAGRAAANGVLSALLAQVGISGARTVLEGPRGFFAGLAPEGDLPGLLARLDTDDPARLQAAPLIAGVSIKPHASCRHTHAPIDAALALREQLGERVGQIAAAEVVAYRAALDLCDNANPLTAAQAKFSLQFCVARALCCGDVGLAAFDEEALGERPVRALLPRIRVRAAEPFESRYPAHWSANLVVTLDTGERLEQEQIDPLGDPENPLNPTQLADKFRSLVGWAGVSQALTEAWLEWVMVLPERTDPWASAPDF